MRRITAIYLLLTETATILFSANGASAQAVTPVSVGLLDLLDFSKWSAAHEFGTIQVIPVSINRWVVRQNFG